MQHSQVDWERTGRAGCEDILVRAECQLLQRATRWLVHQVRRARLCGQCILPHL